MNCYNFYKVECLFGFFCVDQMFIFFYIESEDEEVFNDSIADIFMSWE